jgi:glycosyltransferase involved in cell wall biosynthesis
MIPQPAFDSRRTMARTPPATSMFPWLFLTGNRPWPYRFDAPDAIMQRFNFSQDRRRMPGGASVIGWHFRLSQIAVPWGYSLPMAAGLDGPRRRGSYPARCGQGVGRLTWKVIVLFGRFVYPFKIRVIELLFHPLVAVAGSLLVFAIAIGFRPLARRRSFSLLCRSHCIHLRDTRNGPLSAALNREIERVLKRAIAPDGLVEFFTEGQAPGEIDPRAFAKVALVVKAPQYEDGRVVERGVLLLKNTEQFDSFRRCANMVSILDRYALVLEPSWSAYANPRLLSFCIYRDHPIVVMSPCQADYRFLERLGSNLRPIACGPGDWVDPRIFRPLEGQEKRYDVVMIARWTLWKHHHLLFQALQRVGDPSFRVALVAMNTPSDTDRELILPLIGKLSRVCQVTVFEDIEPAAVNQLLNQSKVNLLLSRQEGGNRSLFEGFFAGVPGLAFSNHIGIPLAHFTPQTGRLIAEHELAGALYYFRNHWAEFDPSTWALAHIAPDLTTAKLNLFLQQLAKERRERWTKDIVGKCNCPNMRYYPDDSAGKGLTRIEDLLAQ